MNRTLRNFRLDIFLYLLLGMNIVLVILSRRGAPGTHPGFGWHLHGVIGTLLTIACLIHVALHWRCFHAMLTGKVKNKGKFIMQGLVTLMMVLASVSGHGDAGGFHSVTGTLALIGLSIHAIKRVRWMVLTAKQLNDNAQSLQEAGSSD